MPDTALVVPQFTTFFAPWLHLKKVFYDSQLGGTRHEFCRHFASLLGPAIEKIDGLSNYLRHALGAGGTI